MVDLFLSIFVRIVICIVSIVIYELTCIDVLEGFIDRRLHISVCPALVTGPILCYSLISRHYKRVTVLFPVAMEICKHW